ncbi:putative mitochondrial Rho GTPase [Phytophthora cinnamomi]|uniref:putative mitochondrial Rho GTPase n=1 Tax=Phytophthora cinnamomi TaxID=4785 RepID=UPI00355A7340|nr:putative mitochondrial Rho GTPase [Phytophthora cinnamomi]
MAATAASKPARGDEAAEPARAKLPLKPQVVRIEVLGDEKVGKTSLICSLVSRHFSEKVPSVLLNVQIPAEESDENVIISITDTSSRVSDLMRVTNAAKRSDAILLVYDLTRPETFQRLRRWLDFIAKNKEIPVVLVANKVDINAVTPTTDGPYASQVRHLVNTYPFVVSEVECSAKNFTQVAQAFFLAQKAVLYPVAPLYNEKKRQLQPKCLKAIKRTFRLYNRDRSGILSRDELNEYQYDCFGVRLLSTEIDTLMEYLSSEVPSGVAPDRSGLFVDGFIYLWWLFIDRNRPESGWQVLRSLGYNNDLHLEIPPERLQLPPYEEDQSAQLTPQTVEFLTNLFRQFDANKDNNIAENEVEAIFSICEDESAPWTTCSAISSPLLYERTMVDGKPTLSLAVWLACWSFVAQENPQKLLETLFYLGYNDKLFPAIEFVKSRSLTRKAMRIDRNVISCYIFGSPDSGKEHFLHTFVGDKEAPLTDDEQFILRGIGAVPDRDTTKYLFITDALSDDEIEMKADVLLLVLNPEDEPSKVFVEELDKKLPASIPRVVISYKLEKQDDDVEEGKVDESSALVKEEPIDFAIDATLKQYPTALKCYEAHSVKDEVARVLVATALRPPKNARSKSSGIWLPGRKTGMGVIGLTAAAAVVAFVAKPEESKAVVNDIVSRIRR